MNIDPWQSARIEIHTTSASPSAPSALLAIWFIYNYDARLGYMPLGIS